MYRLLLIMWVVASCDYRARPTESTDEGLMATDTLTQEEMSTCTNHSSADSTSAAAITPVHQTTSTLVQPVCKTDNACLVASIDQTTGTCEFQIVDQQGAVYCDDHNPCTEDDMCYDDVCLGEIIEGCTLDQWYYY